MELFVKLGLKEIASIIQTLGEAHDVSEFSDVIEYNGNQYHVMKENDELIITSQDGRNMCVSIGYDEKRVREQNRDVIYTKHEANIDYFFNDGTSINLKNNLGLDRGYEGFTSVQRHNLLTGLGCKYYDQDGNDIAAFSIGLDKLCLNGNRRVYEFSDQGIKYGNKLVSLDGEKLLLLGGSEVPDVDTVRSFNLGEEKSKVNTFAKESVQLHPFTREALRDTERFLDRKERKVKEVLDFYDKDLKDLRKAISVREDIIDVTEDDVLTPDELDVISNELRNKLVLGRRRTR